MFFLKFLIDEIHHSHEPRFQQMLDTNGATVLALKRHLSGRIGKPRFRLSLKNGTKTANVGRIPQASPLFRNDLRFGMP
jgi:hypothetical protein